MWRSVALVALGVSFGVSGAFAQGSVHNPKAAITRDLLAKQSTQRTYGWPACSYCYTCGGPWPYFSGMMYTPAPSYTVERGARCTGPLAYRRDSTPYLCCGIDQ
jgi:hypothetical protein